MFKDLCRIGSDMTRKNWKLIAFPGFIGLLALTLLSRCSPIEEDLQHRSQTLLTDQGMNWAKTELDGRGRDLLLTGIAPSEDAKNKAIKLTQGVYGVRTVDHNITVKEYVSSVFQLKHSDNKIILEGSLPNQSSIDLAVLKAQSLYGETSVVNDLTINEMARNPKWLADATGLMAALYGAQNFAMDATDNHVNISGTVATEEAKTQLIQQAQASFGDQFSESINVVRIGPSPEELAAEAARAAEEQRLAAEKEAVRIAKEQRLAAEKEAARIAEEQRLAAEKEAARIAEEQRLAAEKEAARIAEEQRLAAEKEAARIAAEQRLAAEKEAARIAEEQRLAAEKEAARIAEEQRLAAEKEAKKLAEQNRKLLAFCQLQLNELINTNPPIFTTDSTMIRGNGYGLLGLITLHVNSCSELLHKNNLYINVVSQAGIDETTPQTSELGYARAQAIVSYLEHINGIHPGLLRARENTSQESIGSAQLHFTITE